MTPADRSRESPMRRTASVALVGAASAVFGFAFAAGAQGPELASSSAADAVVFKVPNVNALRLFLRDKDGKTYGSLEAVRSAVASSGHKVVFAMNAGMYEADRTPTGLFVQDGNQVAALNVQTRPQGKHTPNFFLSPNGVFAIGSSGPVILSTLEFAKSPPKRISLATQSGPLLLAGGAIVSQAVATGSDEQQLRNRRNGICLNGKTAVMVEVGAMTLHQFAVYLRDDLGCQDALYMDGGISSVYDARTGRSDQVPAQNPLGPIIAYIE
jgi:uncharacterized protein YigE (DUF2233 family)